MSVVDVPEHGTARGYRLGCRCDECRQAHTDYLRVGHHQRGTHRPLDVVSAERRAIADERHGTETRYNRGCRCEGCTSAASAARADRRSRQLSEHEHALGLLHHSPEYRALIRQRVSDEQKRRHAFESRSFGRGEWRDVDKLGREIEGCG